jgi:hypothetical protein
MNVGSVAWYLFCSFTAVLSLHHNVVACIKQVKRFLYRVYDSNIQQCSLNTENRSHIGCATCNVVDRPFVLTFQSTLLPLSLGH